MIKITAVLLVLLLGFCMPSNKAMAQTEDTTYAVTDSTVIDEDDDEEYTEEDDEDDTVKAVNEIRITPRLIEADSLASLKNDKGFYYMVYLDSLLRAEQSTIKKQPEPERKSDNSVSFFELSIVKYAFWALGILIVGYVLYNFYNGQGGLFRRNTASTVPTVEVDTEIPDTDLKGLLQRAEKNKDFRSAVRFQFLLTLQRLGDRGILQLSTDKTNYQYATELQRKPYAANFARLSLQYEYVWFGEFQINEEQYNSIQQEYQQFLKAI